MFGWFCKHDWKLVESTYDKSPIERLVSAGLKSSKGSIDAYFGTRIIICQCTKCGKLNKTVESV